jgi:hypothetical protein
MFHEDPLKECVVKNILKRGNTYQFLIGQLILTNLLSPFASATGPLAKSALGTKNCIR